MKRLIAAAALLALAAQSAPITTIILVRHAERVSMTDKDSPLSEAGVAHANALAKMLCDANIRAIYVTQFQRTQQTAKPFNIAPVILTTGPTYAADVVSRIKKEHTGETVLVISHSNTIPEILTQLGVKNPPSIADDPFDDVFIVTTNGGTPAMTRLHVAAR